MSREISMFKIMAANAKLQKHMANILEAKAIELKKTRDWLCDHRSTDEYLESIHRFNDSISLNREIVEIINGITKVEKGLALNLGILLDSGEDASDYPMDNSSFNSDGV